MTTTYVSSDPAVVKFVASQNGGPDNRGGTALFSPGLMYNGIAGSTSDNVIGFSSLTSSGTSPIAMGTGFNALIIDGQNSAAAAASGSPDNYSFTVDPSGLVTVTDSSTGATQQVSGVSFLIFDGAATGTDSNGNSDYQQMYFIGNANQSEVTELYNAAFGRQPDLGGVEYYMNQLNSGMTFQQIASEFMNSPEFQTRFGANVSDTQFVDNLYQNVLHRTAGASEVAYYTAALANAEAGSIVNATNPVAWSRAQELLNFTNSPENQTDTAGFVINTSATATNGLVYVTPASESALTVLNQALQTGDVNTTDINPSSVNGVVHTSQTGISSSGDTLLPNAGVSTIETSGTFTLSPAFPDFYGASNTSTFTVNGSAGGGSYITIASGTVNLFGTGNTIYETQFGTSFFTPSPVTVVNGFVTGDTLQNSTMLGGEGTYVLLSPSSSNPLHGTTLSQFAFGTVNSNEYIVNVGSVGSGTATEVAAAATKVYVPSDAFGEQIIFFGAITSGANAGGTAVFDWVDYSGAPSSADSNGNHQVDATEFDSGVILVGVPSTSISTSSFYHK